MARLGKFGRSGTTQNMTMLVYQIMKQQMADELDSILQAYKTNMQDGKYTTQFNGQNVDGEFVIAYYKSMLAGFPPGTTEYETINSKLKEFERQFQDDIQTVIIDALNNGTQIDFGLLGGDFPNKGISEVELSDVRSWATSKIAELEANGESTRADKLKGAVYVAGFNIENDGKAAAVDRGELSYGSYAKWLKGQLDAALANGLTKDSQPYRDIMSQYSKALKSAKIDGENKAYERVTKAITEAMSNVENAAQIIIDKYLASADPSYNQQVYDALASGEGYYGALQSLAAGKQVDGKLAYDSIMMVAGENINSMFAQAVSDTNSTLDDLNDNGLGGLAADQKLALSSRITGLIGKGNAFVSNSGVGFQFGAGKNAMEAFKRNVSAAGAVQMGDRPQAGELVNGGGHPGAMRAAFEQLGADIRNLEGANVYPWLNSLANGYISANMDAEGLKEFDINTDGKITIEEISKRVTDGNLQYNQLTNLQNTLMAQATEFDMPSSKMSPSAIINMFIDIAYNEAMVAKGSKIVVDQYGHASVTEPGNTSLPNHIPMQITVAGKKSWVFVSPTKILEQVEGSNPREIDPGKIGGTSISVYRRPTIGAEDLGQVDAFVRIDGSFAYGAGTPTSGKSLMVPFDVYRAALKYVGIEVQADSWINPKEGVNPEIIVATDSTDKVRWTDANLKNFWSDVFTNPDSQYYIGKLKFDDGTPVAPQAAGADYTYYGTNNTSKENDVIISDLFAPGRDSIMADAAAIAAKLGPNAPVTRDHVITAIMNRVPEIQGGVQALSIKDSITSSLKFQTRLNEMFPDIQAATASPAPVPGTGYGGWTGVQPSVGTPAYPTMNPYIQSQSIDGTSFINNAFRNTAALNPVKPVSTVPPSIKPSTTPSVKPVVTPTIKPVGVTSPTTGAAPVSKPSVTAAGVTGPAGTINSGFTRGIS